jgi:hypothetical protein
MIKFVESKHADCPLCCFDKTPSRCKRVKCKRGERKDGNEGYYIQVNKPRPTKYERLMKALLASCTVEDGFLRMKAGEYFSEMSASTVKQLIAIKARMLYG